MSVDPSKIKAGKAGRKASPWNEGPHSCTPKAQQLFSKHRRLRMIAEAAARVKAKGDGA